MFKKTLFLTYTLSVSVLAGLAGMSSAAPSTNRFATLVKYSPELELTSAIMRSYLVFSSKSSKNPGRIKLVLTDLARITNETLSHINYVKSKKCSNSPNYKEFSIARNLSLLLVALDIFDLGKHFVMGKQSECDKRLSGIAKLIDSELLPAIESAAALIRAGDSIAVSSKYGTVANFVPQNVETAWNKVESCNPDYWCTVAIIYARLFSSMVRSGFGSSSLKWELLLAVAFSLTVLRDTKPELFGSISRNIDHLVLTTGLDKNNAEQFLPKRLNNCFNRLLNFCAAAPKAIQDRFYRDNE